MSWQPGSQRVLVIEDDVLFADFVVRLLKQDQRVHDVDIATTVSDGRSLLERGTYDAVFLDVSLPDGSGLDVVPGHSDRALGCPVIVITGDEGRAVWGRAAAAGATSLLPKASLQASSLLGCLEFSYEATASERVLRTATEASSDLLGAGTTTNELDKALTGALERLVDSLGAEGATLELVDPHGTITSSAQVGCVPDTDPSDGGPHRVVRSQLGSHCRLALWASSRRWSRVDSSLEVFCDALLSASIIVENGKQLHNGEQRYRAVANATGDMILTVDADGIIVAGNSAFRRGVGAGFPGRTLKSLIDKSPFFALASELLAGAIEDGSAEVQDRAVEINNHRRWYSARAVRATTGPDGGAVHVVMTETTGRVITEQELSTLALTDPLTGLLNRRLALDRLQHSLDQVGRRDDVVVVCQFDLDHFKTINDLYGHSTGDTVLTETSKRVKALVRESDTAARLGGDEFLVVAEGFNNVFVADGFVQRLHDQITQPVIMNGREIDLGASIGYAAVRDAGLTAAEVLERADAALYRAKRAGRNRWAGFDDAGHVFESPAETSRQLKLALDEDRFVLRFQPIALGGGLVGAEALLRLRHPTLGELAPIDFIEVLVNSPFVIPVGAWVIDESVRSLAAWRSAGLVGDDFKVHVNVAPQQLAERGFAGMVLETLERHDIAPKQLAIELTEQALIDLSRRESGLEQLAEAGVDVYLDDFGTGASSVAHLRSHLLRGLKVDRSFVMQGEQDSRDSRIVHGLVAMAHSLNLDVIVEGVEQDNSLDWLEPPAPIAIQGFAYSVPLLPTEFETFLELPPHDVALTG